MNIRMGACAITFDGVDLGHTKGGVKLSYKVESESVETDQSDAPVDVVITKQPVEITVPMVDFQFEKLSKLIPNCNLIIDATDPTKKRLEITGEGGSSLAKQAKQLILKPLSGTPNDWVTIYYAVAIPEFDLSFEKGTNVHVYNIRFQALAGEKGYVAFGDPNAED